MLKKKSWNDKSVDCIRTKIPLIAGHKTDTLPVWYTTDEILYSKNHFDIFNKGDQGLRVFKYTLTREADKIDNYTLYCDYVLNIFWDYL